MNVTPVRLLALDVLQAVTSGDDLDRILDRARGQLPEARDRSLLAELVKGTLQWQALYDHLIKQFSRRRSPREIRLVNILRLSLHQLVGLDGIPAYAAIHEAGQLCRSHASTRRFVPFVNGLLQSVQRSFQTAAGDRRERLAALLGDTGADPAEALAVRESLPAWLIRRWLARWGEEATVAICRFQNEPFPVTCHVLPGVSQQVALDLMAEAGHECSAGRGPRSLVLTGKPDQTELTRLLEDFPFLIVQDESVQDATGWLLRGVSGTWLDMCAAPGGKTAHLACGLPEATCAVAMDTRPGRVQLLCQTLKRIEQVRVNVLLADGKRPPLGRNSLDVVLLDGPCSGTGVLRHHPDGRWRLEPGDLQGHGRDLVALGLSAGELLRPGGYLLYATCSLEAEENEDVVAELIARTGDLQPAADEDGRWQRVWLPGQLGGDGFFAARLRKMG